MPSNVDPWAEGRLRVVVVPEQFPHDEDDIGGVFTRDYIAAIGPYCDVTVLVPGREERRGVTRRLDAADGVEYVTHTPAIRGRGAKRERLGRLEGLYRLGGAASVLGDVDLIHAHGPVFHGVPALRLAQRLGVPLVVTVHTGPFSKLLQQRTMRYLTRRTLERADCVCPVSDDLRVQIEQAGIVPRRVEVTYNPVDTALFRPSTNLRTTHRRIAFAGRLEEYKGGLRVACAFAEVADKLPGWTLSIAGDGPERDAIQAFVAGRLDLAGRVGLLGRYTKPELADMLRASDLFACPSRHETFGLVIAEAMAAGLPVIAPDRTAPPEFVDKRSGVLVSPDDIEAIAAAMERIATSLSTYDRAAIRGRIVDRFGIEAFGERLLGIYRSLLPARLPEGEAACVD